jgi:hypothetical protein
LIFPDEIQCRCMTFLFANCFSSYSACRRSREIEKFSNIVVFVFHFTYSTQVTATDGDKDRPQNIVYFLTGQGIDPDNPANSKFDINRTTGEIFVLKVREKYFLTISVSSLAVSQQIELNGNNFYDFILEGRTC